MGVFLSEKHPFWPIGQIKQSFSESPVKCTQPKDKKVAMVLLSVFVSSGNVPNRRIKETEMVSL